MCCVLYAWSRWNKWVGRFKVAESSKQKYSYSTSGVNYSTSVILSGCYIPSLPNIHNGRRRGQKDRDGASEVKRSNFSSKTSRFSLHDVEGSQPAGPRVLTYSLESWALFWNLSLPSVRSVALTKDKLDLRCSIWWPVLQLEATSGRIGF